MTEEKNIQKTMPHNVVMKSCEKLSLTGVRDVGSFDENIIACFTDNGELIIKGDMLHIEKMDTTSGDMEVIGKVSSLTYTGEERRRSGFISKLFK
ncbi:MAG: YabP/YqfC family sporulation protein [Oscillospiraceae bacterium]|nr:YabP/YqfC family sporulation protein [Oscillospiraceae bacterium]